MEILRILERNNNKIFIVRQERFYGGCLGATNEYSHESSCFDALPYPYGSLLRRDKPLFKISIKPRTACKMHTEEKELHYQGRERRASSSGCSAA